MIHGLIALLAAAASTGDVAVFPAAGPETVTTLPESIVQPCWASPTTLLTLEDGGLLQRREGDAAPTTVRRVPGAVLDGAFAPGCNALAEVRRPDGHLSVWLRNGSTAPRRVLQTHSRWETRPRVAWTPDGRRFAVAPREANTRLRVVDAATGQVVRGFKAASGVDDLGAQAISRDGRRVVYSDGDYVLQLADVETGRVRRLAARFAGNAAFARTSDRIAFKTGRAIKIIDLHGKTLTSIPVKDADVSSLAWSPDDTKLAVNYSDSGETVAVGVIDLTAPAPAIEERLPSKLSFVGPPAWSPDGTRLAVARVPFSE